MGYKIGVDVGGTFTDICLFDEETGAVHVHKLPSTPGDPSEAIGNGIIQILEQNDVPAKSVTYLAHGTTVATNATLERKGCRTGIITTKGFRDLIELARQKRPSLYDVQADKPAPIVYKQFRKEVNERLNYKGEILTPLNPDEVAAVVDELKALGVVAYAVCLLHAYINPVHEQMIAGIIRDRHPEAYISISSSVVPEYREYERMSTTALNSYIGPLVGKYATRFKQRVLDMGMSLVPYINQSNGGLMSIETTFSYPIRTALSGPAAGVSGANYIAQAARIDNFITFDMGGTSTDVSLVEHNTPRLTTSKNIADFPVRVPMIDVTAVGAGGGSIAWVDNGGVLKVGPHSAGAVPGPAAYCKGGILPTVTDANVVLHRLNPQRILGGRMPIDEQAAYNAIEEHLARPLNISVLDAARGIITVVNSNMDRAIRIVSVERGYDPREFVLMAFGGAGALHAAMVGKNLDIGKVLIPCNSGILCAMGLLVSDIRSDYVKTCLLPFQIDNIAQINSCLHDLAADGDAWLAGEKVPPEQRVQIRSADMRYVGQNFELSIPFDIEQLDEESFLRIRARFDDEHKREYGYCWESADVQIVNCRVAALGKVSTIKLSEQQQPEKDAAAAIIDTRDVYFEETQDYVATHIYNRNLLRYGNLLCGPAIIEQMDATIVVPPGHRAEVDSNLSIMIIHDNDPKKNEREGAIAHECI
ncbi:MAG: hydantoinase/oxoprolinase family protein [Eubacteriales bacterium]|nr:hydantoinase/oxoprolinase family protein [Eubacteriales bacterium]